VISTSAANAPATQCTATCIFERMQRAVNALPEPNYVAFTFRNESQAVNGTNERDVLRVVVRMRDGDAVIVALHDGRGEVIAHPAPRVVTGPNDYMAVSNIFRLGDFPAADFGLRFVRPARPDFFDAEPQPTNSPPPVIATVTAIGGVPYRIEDRGIEQLNGTPAYHLAFSPLRNPAHNVLREVWIDTASNLPIRYLAERTVADPGEYYTYFVTVNAAKIGGHLVNVDAEGVGRNGLGKWSVTDVTFPDTEPDWIFDRSQWPKHAGEPIPNLAPSQPIE
jgi:hypothetical protein